MNWGNNHIKEFEVLNIPIYKEALRDIENFKNEEQEIRRTIIKSGILTLKGQTMFFCTNKIRKNKPENGFSLVFGLHGGGACDPKANDQQHENHKSLYKLPSDCIWLTPRSAENVWNMWHLPYIDDMIDYLIQSFIILDLINVNKVFLTGYSAGGDGAYRLGARLADRFGGIGAMAGHPGDVSILSFRNVALAIQMGELDSAYNRNELAKEWGQKLGELKGQDFEGYEHLVQIHNDEAHWMHLKDQQSVNWLIEHNRSPLPVKIIWKLCNDAAHCSFYWLAVSFEDKKPGALIEARVEDRRFIHIKSKDVNEICVRLNDYLINLDEDIYIYFNNSLAFAGKVERDYETARKFALKRLDPFYIFVKEIKVKSSEE
jgi:hypothetical protein